MEIRKRNGESVPFQQEKIFNAMKKAFDGQGKEIGSREMDEILATVLNNLSVTVPLTVERVQDEVERTLMERGHYEVAKAYILYREKRSALRRVRHTIARTVGDDSLDEVLRRIQMDFTEEVYSLAALQMKFESFCRPGMTEDERAEALTKAAVELTTAEAPKWEFIAARLLNHSFRCRNAQEWEGRGVGDLYGRLRYLTDKGLYGDYILAHYTHEEIAMAEDFLCPERDELFTYSGLDLLLKRYVIQSRSRLPLETPQEMFLGIALHLAMNEGSDRMGWVKRFYDMLSRMEVTMATPTMSNARKPYHQLSSCFVDTVPDSLDGIYRSLDNFAKVSKFGGGMGMYFGKVRAAGSTIRGFQGAAGGVIRWIRLVNDTAVAVDQLGMRQGAVAVYLDAWHRDLPEFLQLRTNNGDDRMKAHDVFPAVCYPDLFWRLAEENIDAPWHLMCPHEILTVKGYALEDYWGTEWEKRYLDCVNDPRIEKRSVTVKDIVRLVLRSAVETGTPFAFNRDSVNRMNPNGHTGMIYCSNLCTEIAQNMAPIKHTTICSGSPFTPLRSPPAISTVSPMASLCRITASIWCSRRMPTPIIWMPHWISVLSCSTSPLSPPSGRGRYAGNFHLLRPTACRKDFAPLRCTTCNDSGGSKATVKCATVDPRLSVCSIRKEKPISQSLSKENRRYFLYGYPNGNRCHPLCRGGRQHIGTL